MIFLVTYIAQNIMLFIISFWFHGISKYFSFYKALLFNLGNTKYQFCNCPVLMILSYGVLKYVLKTMAATKAFSSSHTKTDIF